MLAKFKRPDMYINYGVWVFEDGLDYPTKHKIKSMQMAFNEEGFFIKEVFLDSVGWVSADSVYMTKLEACADQIRDLQYAVKDCDRYLARTVENMHYKKKGISDKLEKLRKYQWRKTNFNKMTKEKKNA